MEVSCAQKPLFGCPLTVSTWGKNICSNKLCCSITLQLSRSYIATKSSTVNNLKRPMQCKKNVFIALQNLLQSVLTASPLTNFSVSGKFDALFIIRVSLSALVFSHNPKACREVYAAKLTHMGI